jgi:hypothetical protein
MPIKRRFCPGETHLRQRIRHLRHPVSLSRLGAVDSSCSHAKSEIERSAHNRMLSDLNARLRVAHAQTSQIYGNWSRI